MEIFSMELAEGDLSFPKLFHDQVIEKYIINWQLFHKITKNKGILKQIKMYKTNVIIGILSRSLKGWK